MINNDTTAPRKDKGKFYHIKWVLREWRPHKYFIFILLFLTLLSTTVSIAYPIFYRQLIDTLNNNLSDESIVNDMTPIYRFCMMLFFLGIARLVSSSYPGFRAYMNLLFEYLLRKRYFKSIVEKDYSFFMRFRTGDLVTRLTNDIHDFPKIGWFLCSGIFRAFDSSIRIIFCIIVMFILSWNLTLLVLVPIPFMVLVFYMVSEKLHKRFKKNQEAVSEINNQLEMTFSGIKIIKSFVCEEKYKRFFDNALKNRFKTEIKLVRINTVLHLIYEYIDWLALIGVILYGGYLTVIGNISIGTFVAFYSYLSMLVYPILDIPTLFTSGRQAFVCIDRLEEISDFPVNNYVSENKIIVKEIESIRFDNVCFKYEDRKVDILKNISFEIKKAEKVLILGRSGAGKTTILGLLCGLLIPTSGEIFINDTPLKNLDQKSIRDLLGYVPQEPSLFTGTIKENVLFGEQESIEDEDYYKEIISAVQMSEEIEQFVDKDNTKLGIKGLSLSGGQKQRIAIARALHKKPQVLILDDITASLDAKKEELLWEQISYLFKDLTAFIVSHRLSSIRYVDKVIFLNDNEINALGKHEDLLDKCSNYRDFVMQHYK